MKYFWNSDRNIFTDQSLIYQKWSKFYASLYNRADSNATPDQQNSVLPKLNIPKIDGIRIDKAKVKISESEGTV